MSADAYFDTTPARCKCGEELIGPTADTALCPVCQESTLAERERGDRWFIIATAYHRAESGPAEAREARLGYARGAYEAAVKAEANLIKPNTPTTP